MEKSITIESMQHAASFWVMLSGFLSNVEVENSDGKKIKRALLQTAEREIAILNQKYDEIKSD